MNKILTIFTPTFNRRHTIHRTYESILKQDQFLLDRVEWLIVDDGSTDGTDELIGDWLKDELPFTLRYIKQTNGGKHTAFNRAIREAKGTFFFVVDSDDWLTDDCVGNILEKVDIILNLKDVCGLVALKCFPDGNIIGKSFLENTPPSSLYELSVHRQGGERSLVFKTDIIRNYVYPVIPDELFIGECVVYDKLDEKYKYIVSNDILTVCEYQADGLTRNIVSLMLRNPIGYKIYYSQRIDMAVSLKERFGYAIRYWAFKVMKQDSLYDYKGKHKAFVFLCIPFGYMTYMYYQLRK